MDKIKNILLVLGLIFLLMNGIGWIRVFSSSILGGQNVQILESLVQDTIKKSVKKEIKENLDKIYNSDFDLPVEIVSYNFRNCRTPEEVERLMKKMHEEDWGAQIGCIKVIAKNEYARERLKSVLYDEKFVKIILKDYM